MLKHVMKSWYAHNSNYKEWEDKVLKYMNKEEFEDLMFFLKDLYDIIFHIQHFMICKKSVKYLKLFKTT